MFLKRACYVAENGRVGWIQVGTDGSGALDELRWVRMNSCEYVCRITVVLIQDTFTWLLFSSLLIFHFPGVKWVGGRGSVDLK